jgi:hypothetical protein
MAVAGVQVPSEWQRRALLTFSYSSWRTLLLADLITTSEQCVRNSMQVVMELRQTIASLRAENAALSDAFVRLCAGGATDWGAVLTGLPAHVSARLPPAPPPAAPPAPLEASQGAGGDGPAAADAPTAPLRPRTAKQAPRVLGDPQPRSPLGHSSNSISQQSVHREDSTGSPPLQGQEQGEGESESQHDPGNAHATHATRLATAVRRSPSLGRRQVAAAWRNSPEVAAIEAEFRRLAQSRAPQRCAGFESSLCIPLAASP